MGSITTPDTHSIHHVLSAGWRLFTTGLQTVFPWVLAAELIQELPFANPPGSIFDTDFSLFMQPDYLLRALACGAAQAVLYGIAVLRLVRLAGDGAEARGDASMALRTFPAVLVGYLCYELIVIIGLMFTFGFFMLGMFVAGPLAGLVLCILPLAPTAAASTALALFIFPAVLEKRNPFAALGESSRLAKTAWVKVSLVISVPAVALLVASLVTDYTNLSHAISQGSDLLRKAQESGDSTQDLSGLLASFDVQPTADRYERWQLIGTVFGAFAWWYTLAVCYAQYRDLKRSA